MTDLILILVLVLIAGLAAVYIYRAKKNGAACIGCPHAKQCGGAHAHQEQGTCSGHCSSCCGCGNADKDDTPTENP